MTVKVGDVLEVDKFLSDESTQVVAEVCGNVMFLRPDGWNVGCGVKPYTINPWPAKFLRPKPPPSPDDVVHEFNGDIGRVQIARCGRFRAVPVGAWMANAWSAEIAKLVLALKEKA